MGHTYLLTYITDFVREHSFNKPGRLQKKSVVLSNFLGHLSFRKGASIFLIWTGVCVCVCVCVCVSGGGRGTSKTLLFCLKQEQQLYV